MQVIRCACGILLADPIVYGGLFQSNRNPLSVRELLYKAPKCNIIVVVVVVVVERVFL